MYSIEYIIFPLTISCTVPDIFLLRNLMVFFPKKSSSLNVFFGEDRVFKKSPRHSVLVTDEFNIYFFISLFVETFKATHTYIYIIVIFKG